MEVTLRIARRRRAGRKSGYRLRSGREREILELKKEDKALIKAHGYAYMMKRKLARYVEAQ